MTASAIPAVPRRARMARYALWQSGEFVMNIAIITILLFALIGGFTLMNVHAQEEIAAAQHRTVPLAMKIAMFRELFASFAMVGPIIAMSGIISSDRTGGFTRFLFAKPVSPRRYYLQALLVRFLGFLVVGHVLILAYGFLEPPAYTPKMLVDLVVHFLIVGGLTLLFSALTKFDGLITIVVLMLSSMFWGLWEHKDGWRNVLMHAFPPIEKVGAMNSWMLGLNQLGLSPTPDPFPAKWVVWLSAYGLAAIILGLYLLRKVPLTKA